MEKNKISIITVVKNSSKTIEKTIQSLLSQKYKNVEYLVIDGNSTDGTLEILNKYKENISLLISEEDKGIWDAMNKGVSLAKGDIVGFLNADDTYYENSLNIVNEYFNKNKIDFYNSKFLSADLDFFFRMIVKFKLKGIETKKNEILGKFGKGGFSSKINYIDHLKDMNQIRIHNKQNKYFVYFLYIFKILKKPFKFLSAINKKT